MVAQPSVSPAAASSGGDAGDVAELRRELQRVSREVVQLRAALTVLLQGQSGAAAAATQALNV